MDFIKQLEEKLCGLIPGRISNRLVLEVYDLMRKSQFLCRKDYSEKLQQNTASFSAHLPSIRKAGGYVEDQHSYEDMSYGETTMKHAGCEIFAVYNALHTLESSITIHLPELIHEFEKDGMVLSGRFGTSPGALIDYLNRKGYSTESTSREEEFDAFGCRFPALILTMYNNRDDIRDEIHTVHISRNSRGFTAHNVCCNGRVTGPAPSVSALMRMCNKGKSKGLCLIGIRKS